MTIEYDDLAWKREFEHAQTVQEWHKGRERRHKLKLLECAITHFNDEIKDHDHESNDQ